MTQAYYRKTPQQALEAQNASAEGLSAQEARRRAEQYGPNKLSEGKKKSTLQVFLEQFKDLMVLILIIAAVISAFSGNVESTIVIFAVLVLNAILGTVQYEKAEKSLESLKAMASPTAKVMRGGVRVEIPSADVVPGDIVLLEAGDMVVADGRVLENFSLKVNESSLTGESEGVDKTAEAIDADQVALGDQKNMVFSGSLVTYGRATVLVTGTGMDTELGKIAALMNQTQQRKTPLQQSLDSFSAKLAMVIMAICAVVFALSIFRTGMGILDSLMFAVALAVAAIPEALSSIVTIVLAMGTQKMARQNAIMKDLKAVESLGSVSVICSDKTGTLTQNKMTPQKVYADGSLLEGEDLSLVNDVQRLLLKAALLASDATNNEEEGTAIGDPTEVALVMLGEKFGVDEESYRAQHPRLGELAFDSDRKLMSTLHDIDGVPTLFTKGAIDVLLNRSTHLLTREGKVEMTPERREELARVNMELSMEGLRVLAFAFKELDAVRPLTLEDENGFTFIGLISMIDPPRPEAVQAVADAKRGGIRTIMITGDHKVTASAIARQLGIFRDGDEAVSGVELDGMTDTELDERLPRISVYARVSPEHKIRIVNAWQRRGNIVSMTGDGVNDAPALKKADIGVAMGITGTEVSKDAASMILADDNFATIVKAVVNGRSVYANIKNAIQFLLSGNTAGIFCVLYASLLALPVPFQPDQKPRDPKEPILNRPLLARIGGQGLLIAIVTMIAFYLGYQGGDAVMASTMAFATLTLARLFHGFNCRGSESIFRLKLSTNKYSVLAFLAGVVLLLLVLFTPGLKSLFMVAPAFGFANLGEIVLLAFLPTLVIQLVKLVCDARRGKYAVQGEEGGAQGAAEIRLGGEPQGRAQAGLQGLRHAPVAGHAAGHHIGAFGPRAAGQGGGLGGHRLVQAVDNVGGGVVVRDEGHHLRLGKDSTHAGDGQLLLPVQADAGHLLQVQLQGVGHQLQEPSGAGGALVVHHKVGHAARLVQADDLAVLAADVHAGPGLRVAEVGPPGVAGDLGHLSGGKGDVVPAVAGGHDGGHVLRGEAAQGGEGLLRALAGLRAGADDGGGGHVPRPVEHHHVGGGGAAVDARHIGPPPGGGRRGGAELQPLQKGLQPGGELPAG